MCRTDRECIEHCLDGRPDAFRHLVGRYQAVLLTYLAGHLGNREWAEEAAQEAFVRAYFALGKLKKPDSFFSWLLGIAGRVAMEQQRTERRQREAAAARGTVAAGPEAPDDVPLQQAIAELPDVYREVVLLRYYGGRSCAKVAEELGIPLGTVTKRLSRAYTLLRDSLLQSDQSSQRSEVQP
jgi:RNA polymerase sigma-70 factor, ECF subfamily